MTRLSLVSVVLTVLSVAAQLVALSAVRTWGSRARRGLAFSIRVAWRKIEVAVGVRRSVLIQVPSITSTVKVSDGVSVYVIPGHLAEELASYMAHLDGRLAGLAAATQAQGERLASLEAEAERAAVHAAERAADSELAERWIIVGAVLAVLALLSQSFS
jgi:hypothetical protein